MTFLLQRSFKADGQEAIRRGENSKAIDLLQPSFRHEDTTVDEKSKTLQLLCELYFKEKSFRECLETGWKLKEPGQKREVKKLKNVTRLAQVKLIENNIDKSHSNFRCDQSNDSSLSFSQLSLLYLGVVEILVISRSFGPFLLRLRRRYFAIMSSQNAGLCCEANFRELIWLFF